MVKKKLKSLKIYNIKIGGLSQFFIEMARSKYPYLLGVYLLDIFFNTYLNKQIYLF